jgi:error-prone DNA polymerase
MFSALTPLEEVLWDHEAAHHSTRGHPLAPLRQLMRAHRLPDARTVASLRHGERCNYAGVVICRQRPGTASGVTFMTLEDETGFVNVVIWAQVFERYRRIARTTSFLGVTGEIQNEQGLVHLIADRLWIPALGERPAAVPSHDFR